MHNFIGKLFVLRSLSNRLQKAQITFEVLWRMQAISAHQLRSLGIVSFPVFRTYIQTDAKED